ncbi:hypothetical protein BLOT_003092 [Blomia tropicalis]|nr:hypothetical protein BLOT_003092 [Blomia tropicalis]
MDMEKRFVPPKRNPIIIIIILSFSVSTEGEKENTNPNLFGTFRSCFCRSKLASDLFHARESQEAAILYTCKRGGPYHISTPNSDYMNEMNGIVTSIEGERSESTRERLKSRVELHFMGRLVQKGREE